MNPRRVDLPEATRVDVSKCTAAPVAPGRGWWADDGARIYGDRKFDTEAAAIRRARSIVRRRAADLRVEPWARHLTAKSANRPLGVTTRLAGDEVDVDEIAAGVVVWIRALGYWRRGLVESVSRGGSATVVYAVQSSRTVRRKRVPVAGLIVEVDQTPKAAAS